MTMGPNGASAQPMNSTMRRIGGYKAASARMVNSCSPRPRSGRPLYAPASPFSSTSAVRNVETLTPTTHLTFTRPSTALSFTSRSFLVGKGKGTLDQLA